MERKIEQYRKIVRVRKMTAAEKEKLQTMEAELKDVLDRQKAAGIAPRKREAPDRVIGYDPMAAAEVGGSRTRSANSPLPSDSEDSDDDSGDVTMIGRTISLDRDDDLDDIPNSLVEHSSVGTDPLPPMPPGTPPLRPQDLDLDKIWPPLPSGPSPQYLQNNPRPDQHSNNRGRAMAAFSATVLTAEPQVRNLKKELTTLVPAAIARKTKQKERQQVLAAIPMVPKMIVNAAPDVDAEPSVCTPGGSATVSSTGILGAMRPLSGVRFNTQATEAQKQPQLAEPAKPKQEQKSKSSLDEEYQKFVQQMNDFL
ncbi:hypothetical protein GGH13_008680 [Coemansia sp. S155-1]|nr:hypothetical protein GGH13_008680 [Coemansia sp. S155-1]